MLLTILFPLVGDDMQDLVTPGDDRYVIESADVSVHGHHQSQHTLGYSPESWKPNHDLILRRCRLDCYPALLALENLYPFSGRVKYGFGVNLVDI
jgi:hypothetical protein